MVVDLVRRRDHLDEAAARYASLSEREREVFAGVVRGRLNKLIASDLGIVERTVKMHRAHVMTKMNVGVLGLSHDHVWGNLSALATGELGRMAAAAEPDPELRARLRGLHGGVEIHETFDALLERRDLDAVLIFSDNRTSAGFVSLLSATTVRPRRYTYC